MKVHIQLFDFLGASALFLRFKDRFPENPQIDKIWAKTGVSLQNYDFENLIKGLDELAFKEGQTLILFYHMPQYFRKVYTTVSKEKLGLILNSKFGLKFKIRAQDLGFVEEKDGFFSADPSLIQSPGQFKLDEERV